MEDIPQYVPQIIPTFNLQQSHLATKFTPKVSILDVYEIEKRSVAIQLDTDLDSFKGQIIFNLSLNEPKFNAKINEFRL